MYEWVCFSLVGFLLFWSSLFKMLKSDYQTWVKVEIGDASYVNEVKGLIPRSRVI